MPLYTSTEIITSITKTKQLKGVLMTITDLTLAVPVWIHRHAGTMIFWRDDVPRATLLPARLEYESEIFFNKKNYLQKLKKLTSLRIAQFSLSECTCSRNDCNLPKMGSTLPFATPVLSNFPRKENKHDNQQEINQYGVKLIRVTTKSFNVWENCVILRIIAKVSNIQWRI